MNKISLHLLIALLCLFLVWMLFPSCGTTRKAQKLRQRNITATIGLTKESELPSMEILQAKRDTIIVKDPGTGREVYLMKAYQDEETGEMVANEVLKAAVVTARFRNIAERNGKVDLRFEITVPAEMQDKGWQLRFYPDMFILQDSVRLESVIVTGLNYRKAQLKGYEQYQRFLSKIISDTTKFINIRLLEIFLKRNIPEVYAFKTDSSEVSDEMFFSYYGVTEQQAIDHYTNRFLKRINQRRIDARETMYRRYVKVPIGKNGIRLDTVIEAVNGDLVYQYVQTIKTRPKLRKVDIVLSGDVYESDKKIYDIPRSDPLTFYISSLSSFADNTERYMTHVIERRAEANASYRIEFALGKSDVDLKLADNERQIGYVIQNLEDLMQNEVFDLDSIVVVANASPEGSWSANGALSKRRGDAVVKYFNDHMKKYRRRLADERGFAVDEEGRIIDPSKDIPDIRFISRSVPENWDLLDRLVAKSPVLSDEQKARYRSHAGVKDKDHREQLMRSDDYYQFVKDSLYGRLRVVDFSFALHRKGMIKDTVHTTQLDSAYMRGVQLLKDMEYEEAVKILGPYQDYNAAVAYMGCDRNASAMLILNNIGERTAQVNYLMAILYSRTGNEKEAVQCYMNACKQDHSYVHRGNLDPEISELIKIYGLNSRDEEFDAELGY